FQAEDGIRDFHVTGVQTCALPIFSAINTGSSFIPSDQDSLVNSGTGRNYGIELTLERFFNKGYYFLITSSIFDSQYAGSDGIEQIGRASCRERVWRSVSGGSL